MNFIEIVLDAREGNNFVLNKDKNIIRSMDKAILFAEGVPYMAPELVLFLKSPQAYFIHEFHKEKTPRDFMEIMPHLPEESRVWLKKAIATANPSGHEWLAGLLN